MKDQPYLETSPKVSDEIKKTTCYMCACRCGINVHVKDGKVAYIEGNKDHPVNQGVLCAKGSAGIMQVNAPSRLDSPMKRVGPRGSGEFKKISWDEALSLAVQWLKPLRKKAPEKIIEKFETDYGDLMVQLNKQKALLESLEKINN